MKRIVAMVLFSTMLFSALTGLAAARDQVAELKEKIIALQNKGELGFRHFTLCSNIIGYGRYVPLEGDKVKAGTELKIYYEPVNLYTARRDDIYHIWYTQDIVLRTSEGKELQRGEEVLNFNYQTTSPVLDVYATNSLNLGNLPPGVYEYEAVVHDKLKKVDARYVQKFEVVP